MKVKFEYSEDEKRAILEQHNLFKKALQSKVKRLMINEQVEGDASTALSGKDLLSAAIAKNCRIAVGGELQSEDGDPSKPYVIYKKADYNSNNGYFKIGDELYVKDDFTFDVVSTDASGAKKVTKGLKWACKALTADVEAAKVAADAVAAKTKADAEAAIAKTKADADAATKTNLELTQKEGEWKERKDITDTDANIENPQMYEKKVVNGVTLYRRISGKGIAGALDSRQQAVVNKWLAQGAKLEKDVDAEQAKTWTRKLVSPKSDGLFSEDFYMYFPPTTITNAEITAAFQKAVQEQTPESPKDCKETIEAYYSAFKKKKVIEPNMLNAMREKVQACKNEYYGSWGAFRGGNKIDEYLDMLSGVKAGGPSSYGKDSIWRIQ
jgi:hypothetical protein